MECRPLTNASHGLGQPWLMRPSDLDVPHVMRDADKESTNQIAYTHVLQWSIPLPGPSPPS
ncbi:unnamed protein product [Musa hybrid cultivar]